VLYYLLAGFGYTLAALPEWALQAFCRSLGWLVATLPHKRRRGLRSNLHHAFPDKTEAWRRQIALESVRRGLEMVLFVLASPYFTQERLKRQFTVHPELKKFLDDFSANPEPTVVLSPHFSLMEANTVLPFIYGKPLPPIGAMYRPFDSPAIERWVKHTRERWGLRLLSRKEGYYQAVDMLRQKGAVVLLFDQNAGSRGALTLFMDRICSTSELGGLLAEKCKARVSFIYSERSGFMRSVIRGEYLNVPSKEDIVTFASNQWLENKLRGSEDVCADWLWLHNRWRHQDEPSRRFRLESKCNLLAEQLAYFGKTTLPRRTSYFVRMPNWLGDVVMALPLLRALRKARPDVELTLLAQPAFVPLLEKLQVADRLIALPTQGAGYGQFFRKLKEEYPDTHILLTNSTRGDYEAWLTDAPQRYGMVRPGKWRPLLSRKSWRVPADLDETRIHQTRVWEKFFQHFGLKEPLDLTPLAWPNAKHEKKAGLNIGLICGTENAPEKRWPVERWRELIQATLAARPDAVINLFGTARDLPITNAVAEGFAPIQVHNLAGKTNLLEFADALCACEVVVCNDTGGMHLANLLGVPVVAVYGPTNPVRTGPIFDGTKIILQPTGCPATGGADLSTLQTAQVLNALKTWLVRD